MRQKIRPTAALSAARPHNTAGISIAPPAYQVAMADQETAQAAAPIQGVFEPTNPVIQRGKGLEEEFEDSTIAIKPRTISFVERKFAANKAKALTERFIEEQTKYVMKGLGGGGAGFTRSGAVRKFRKAMKRAVRVQAYTDLDEAAKARFGPGSDSPTADYEEMVGGNIAYGAVKPGIDQQLQEEAEHIVSQLNLYKKVYGDVKKSILDSFAAHPKDYKKAGSAGKNVLKTLMAEIHAELKEEKDKIVGKDQSSLNNMAETTAEGQDVIDRARDRVEKAEVGKKSLEKAIDAPTVGRGMKILGGLIDNVIADSGESVELKVTFVIPTGQPGLNVEIHLMGMAARGINGATTAGVAVMGDPKRLEVAAKISVGVGAEAIGLKSSAAIGIFVRAGSDQGTEAALQALSYGAYRGAPSKAFQNLWAPEDKASEVAHKAKKKHDMQAIVLPERTKRQRAEMWAAMIEEKYFKGRGDATFADVGLAIDGSFGLNFGAGKMDLGISESIFSHYDEVLLREKLGDKFAARVLNDARAKERRGEAKGEKKLSLGGSVGFKIGAGSHVIEFGLSVSGGGGDWGVEILGGASTNPAQLSPTSYDQIANGWITGLGEMIKKLRSTASKQMNDDRTGVWGNIFQMTAESTALFDAGMEHGIRAAMASATELTTESAFETPIGSSMESTVGKVSALAATTQLQFVLTFGRSGGKGVVRFELRSKRGIDIGGGTPVNISASKTTRLFAIGKELDGKVHAEILGGRVG